MVKNGEEMLCCLMNVEPVSLTVYLVRRGWHCFSVYEQKLNFFLTWRDHTANGTK